MYTNITQNVLGWHGNLAPLLILLIIWQLVWKGAALWHASRRNDLTWFLILLIVNTAGILEIIYLFAIVKLKFSEVFKRK